jgi:hypothetical protein
MGGLQMHPVEDSFTVHCVEPFHQNRLKQPSGLRVPHGRSMFYMTRQRIGCTQRILLGIFQKSHKIPYGCQPETLSSPTRPVGQGINESPTAATAITSRGKQDQNHDSQSFHLVIPPLLFYQVFGGFKCICEPFFMSEAEIFIDTIFYLKS